VDLANPALPVVGIPLVLLVVVLWLIRYWSRERRQAWSAVAARLGLSQGQSRMAPVLAGTYRGRPLRLDQFSQGRSSAIYTRVVAALERRPGGRLALSPQAAPINRLAQLFGAQDVEVGDPAFDARFTVKSQPPAFARSVLGDAGVRQKLLAEPALFLVEMEGQAVRFVIGDCCETGVDHMRHLEVNAERVRALLDLACDCAAAIDAHGEAAAAAPPSLGRLARLARKPNYAAAGFSLLLGLFMTWGFATQWSAARRSHAVVAVIVKSELAPGGRPEITYRYAVGSSTYESPLFPRLGEGLDEEHARALVRSHPTGQQLTVYYDDAGPSRSVLYRPTSPSVAIYVGVIWAMTGLFLFLALR
jgi:hypothetical protein